MIDLQRVRAILHEVEPAVDRLDGTPLDESDCLTESKRAPDRHERASMSRELQFLANRLELAAALLRHEYWSSRGAPDHMHETTGAR